MLTLGLVEGVLSATLGILFLVGAANENAPLHKIFGPLVVVMLGVAAYGIHDAGAMHETGDVVGLAFFAFIAFFLPLGVMRTAWKMTRMLDGAPEKRGIRRQVIAPATPSVVVPQAQPEVARKVA